MVKGGASRGRTRHFHNSLFFRVKTPGPADSQGVAHPTHYDMSTDQCQPTIVLEPPMKDMPLEVHIPEDEDFLRVAEIRSLAFGVNIYIDILFPHHATPRGRDLLGARLLDMKHNDHTARFVVTKDTATGEIISQAEWHMYSPGETIIPMDLGFVEGNEEEKEYARYIVGTFQAKRREAIKSTKVPLMRK